MTPLKGFRSRLGGSFAGSVLGNALASHIFGGAHRSGSRSQSRLVRTNLARADPDYFWIVDKTNRDLNLSNPGASLLTLFDRNRAVESRIVRTVNLAHAARADPGTDRVVGERVAYHADLLLASLAVRRACS